MRFMVRHIHFSLEFSQRCSITNDNSLRYEMVYASCLLGGRLNQSHPSAGLFHFHVPRLKKLTDVDNVYNVPACQWQKNDDVYFLFLWSEQKDQGCVAYEETAWVRPSGHGTILPFIPQFSVSLVILSMLSSPVFVHRLGLPLNTVCCPHVSL